MCARPRLPAVLGPKFILIFPYPYPYLYPYPYR